MSTTKTKITSALASVALLDAYTDFTLSRQAMNCSPFTMRFYRFTAGAFVTWISNQGLTGPEEVTARYVRQYLAMLADREGVLFQSDEGTRLQGLGLLAIFRRLKKRTGINVTPHAMQRTFTILSLRAGMNPLHVQALGGWASLAMVEHYAQMVDDDLLQAHRDHSPVDKL